MKLAKSSSLANATIHLLDANDKKYYVQKQIIYWEEWLSSGIFLQIAWRLGKQHEINFLYFRHWWILQSSLT
jgi:hypothetical protein